MSGIDEQILDVPICPGCRDVPNFWILYPTMVQNGMNGWYWLFSKAYLSRYTEHSELTVRAGSYGRKPTLDEIVCVTCSGSSNHEFVASHLVFQKIIQHARRLN